MTCAAKKDDMLLMENSQQQFKINPESSTYYNFFGGRGSYCTSLLGLCVHLKLSFPGSQILPYGKMLMNHSSVPTGVSQGYADCRDRVTLHRIIPDRLV